ncbi:hypothetical protein Ach5_18890 [Agrobacterium tumefaciens]|nr:hypothetical protein Ach5_18890 [Agrobacterium tumefaciens]
MGFSPNPFHGVCTLANCKPVIRRVANIGDFVMGFGSSKSDIRYRLIYWMRVGQIMTFNEYWHDLRFEQKKPIVNGSHLKFHGDNIYRYDASGNVIQEPSFHSLPNGLPNIRNINTDTGSTDKVLVADIFGYYGKRALSVPDCFSGIVAVGRGHRTAHSHELRDAVINWLLQDTPNGFCGEPSGWKEIPK